jgi:hypothetical protein
MNKRRIVTIGAAAVLAAGVSAVGFAGPASALPKQSPCATLSTQLEWDQDWWGYYLGLAAAYDNSGNTAAAASAREDAAMFEHLVQNNLTLQIRNGC